MEKIYAKTLNPEHYDYRIYDIREDDYNEVYISGGREYDDIDNKGYLSDIKKLINEYGGYEYEVYYHNSIKEFLEDMLPKKENGKRLSPAEMTFIQKALEKEDDDETICACLTIVTDKVYKWKNLVGCCQGECVTAFYPKDFVSNDYLEFIEAWFWGTGTEIMIHDGNSIPKDESEIEGWTFYTGQWWCYAKDLKKIIKRECGYKDDDEVDVELWLYNGSQTIVHDIYQKAE